MRALENDLPPNITLPNGFTEPQIIFPGAIAIQGPKYDEKVTAKADIDRLSSHLVSGFWRDSLPLIIVADDSDFVSQDMDNFLWVTFTRSNPATDIHGLQSRVVDKHWICDNAMIIDARLKPHHAPPLIEDPKITKKVKRFIYK